MSGYPACHREPSAVPPTALLRCNAGAHRSAFEIMRERYAADMARRFKPAVVSDRMRRGYRYTLVAPATPSPGAAALGVRQPRDLTQRHATFGVLQLLGRGGV